MEFIRKKFSDEVTKQKYNALLPDPSNPKFQKWDSSAWRTVGYLTKIEEGIDRLVLSGLVGGDCDRRLADGFSSVFNFDQRLKIVERLIKQKRLILTDPTRRFSVPVRTGSEEEVIPAIRIVMRYRNMLFHNGVFLYVEGDKVGCTETLWVEVPEGSKHPSVPLIYCANDQSSLHDLARELALGLPFYISKPIFQVNNRVSVDCLKELKKAWKSSQKLLKKDAEQKEKRFDDLQKRLENTDFG